MIALVDLGAKDVLILCLEVPMLKTGLFVPDLLLLERLEPQEQLVSSPSV